VLPRDWKYSVKSSSVILLTLPGGQYTEKIVVGIWFNYIDILVAWKTVDWKWERIAWLILDFIIMAEPACAVPSGWSQWYIE
jgi:hypothetical protein